MSDYEKLKATLTEIGIPFTTTDDSEESSIDNLVDTVIVLTDDGKECFLFFRRDGKYKEMDFVG